MADLTGNPPDVAASGPVHGRRTDEWTPVSRVRTYELVLQNIEAQIVSGALRAGERLPPERELAELLGVSRPAVREALRVLEAQGVVRSQVGQGPGSGTTIDRVPSDALARLLRLHVALGSFPLADAGGNRLMSDMTRAIRESVRIPFLAAVAAMPETGEDSWHRVLDGLRVEHHAVFAAVEAGRAEQAADLLATHIRGFYADLTTSH